MHQLIINSWRTSLRPCCRKKRLKKIKKFENSKGQKDKKNLKILQIFFLKMADIKI